MRRRLLRHTALDNHREARLRERGHFSTDVACPSCGTDLVIDTTAERAVRDADGRLVALEPATVGACGTCEFVKEIR